MKLDPRNNSEHYARSRDVLNASQRALTALAVTVGFGAVGISGHVWAFIPASIAAVFAVADALLAWRGSRAAASSELAGLLSGNACRAIEARAQEYGVDPEALPDGEPWEYIHRDFERDLRVAIGAALNGDGPRLVMLSGEAKSGKTRAAFQALKSEQLRESWLVVPRDGASVASLLQRGALPGSWTPLTIWLDDLERYASVDAGGLHEGMLRNLQCDRPVVLLTTVGGRGGRGSDHAGLLIDPIEQLRGLAACVEVPVKLSAAELSRAGRSYSGRLVSEIEQVGLGRRMVAISELKHKLLRGHERCREGLAVIRAAIDWRRAGVQRPLSAVQLDLLYRHYLPDHLDCSEVLFNAGLRWAREPLPSTQISLLRRAADARDRYEPYDLAVEVAAKTWSGPDQPVLAQIVAFAEPQDCFQLARTAFAADDIPLALELLARAERSEDQRLSATSAFNTGVLLMRNGDLTGAERAYGRADEGGSLRGAYNLGQMLRQRAELGGAEAAYRRADERGSPEGAVNLGVLLERRGDLSGAEAAYRRADQRGSRKGASNLGRLLAERGESTAAQNAFERAQERRRVTP